MNSSSKPTEVIGFFLITCADGEHIAYTMQIADMVDRKSRRFKLVKNEFSTYLPYIWNEIKQLVWQKLLYNVIIITCTLTIVS